MYILPYTRIILVSPKSPDAVSLLMLRAVPPIESKSKRPENNLLEYYGSVWQSYFFIRRNLNFGNRFYPWFSKYNTFIPIIAGELKPYDQGTKIVVTAKFPLIILLIILFYYSAIICPLYLYLREMISSGQYEWSVLLTVLPFLIFFFLWHTISFNHEVSKIKGFLFRVVSARPETRNEHRSSSISFGK